VVHGADSWSSRRFILARWGEVLLPLEDLMPLAIRAGAQRVLPGVIKEKAELEGKIAALLSGDLAVMRAAL